MRYKIEQWDNEKEYWFQVGESSSIISSTEIVRDLKNNNGLELSLQLSISIIINHLFK